MVARSNAVRAHLPFEPAPARCLTPTAVSPDSVYDGAFGSPARQLQLELQKNWAQASATRKSAVRGLFRKVLRRVVLTAGFARRA